MYSLNTNSFTHWLIANFLVQILGALSVRDLKCILIWCRCSMVFLYKISMYICILTITRDSNRKVEVIESKGVQYLVVLPFICSSTQQSNIFLDCVLFSLPMLTLYVIQYYRTYLELLLILMMMPLLLALIGINLRVFPSTPCSTLIVHRITSSPYRPHDIKNCGIQTSYHSVAHKFFQEYTLSLCS